MQWYTDHTVSLPIDKDWRIGTPQSRWGHVDKGVTSGLGWYCVGGTLLGLRDNGYPPLPRRLCSYPIIQYPIILMCSVGNLLKRNQGKVGQGAVVFHRFLQNLNSTFCFIRCNKNAYVHLKPADPTWTWTICTTTRQSGKIKVKQNNQWCQLSSENVFSFNIKTKVITALLMLQEDLGVME